MNAVGIDVSKGKSMVAIMRPFGEIVSTPAEHIKAEYLWSSLEFSDTNYSGAFTEPYPQGGD